MAGIEPDDTQRIPESTSQTTLLPLTKETSGWMTPSFKKSGFPARTACGSALNMTEVLRASQTISSIVNKRELPGLSTTGSLAIRQIRIAIAFAIGIYSRLPRCYASGDAAILTLSRSPRYKSVRPDPVGELRPVGAMLVRVSQVLDDGVFHLLLQMRGLHPKLRHPIDHINHQVKAGGFVQHR